jgi:hypothetical protein
MEESMGRTSRVAVGLLLTCATISPASATIWVFHGIPSGAAENPPTGSPGTGSVSVFFDDVAHTVTYNAFFTGLTAGTTAAHVHVFAPGANPPNGGVATTTPSFPGFPLGVTSGTFNNFFDLTLASSYNASFITNNGGTPASAEAALLAALLEGRAYFNIHTSAFPGGEIRADLSLVPEPSTWMMMLGGFAAAGLVIRRRRKAELAAA